MKQFVKALNKEGKCFEYLFNTFPCISIEKNKIGIYDGLEVKKLIKDRHFIESVNDVQSRASTFFKLMIQNFFRKRKANN